MKRKFMSLLLSLLIACAAIASGTTAHAVESDADNGMKIKKTATANGNGTYTIQLEAYATGKTITTTETKDVPSDIVLVLDQSYSMLQPMETRWVQYSGKRTNQNYLQNEDKLYYRLDDGTYTKLLVDLNQQPDYYSYGYYNAQGNYTFLSYLKGHQTNPDNTGYGNGTFYANRVYVKYESSESRLDALKTALNGFVDSVAAKAKGADGAFGGGDDVNHRIAMIGFSHEGGGTELFIGATGYEHKDGNVPYERAFQDMDTDVGVNNVEKSANAIAALYQTRTDLGMEMAKNVLDSNPVEDGEQRNRVVILFTDGYPGGTSTEFDWTVANSAIKCAESIKNAGAKVYSIGIFSGADGTSAGNTNANDPVGNTNYFLQHISSNNGTVSNPSFYLSAADADSLNSIFQQISNNIETGGASTTLGTATMIQDIIAPVFTLPAGTTANDITLETWNGVEGNWTKNENAMGATATVNGDKVSVTGFDFSKNWCGTDTAADGTVTEHKGNKLVIKFNVTPKDGYLGGNNVNTNANAGVYENSEAQEPILTFNHPQVNVPIQDITVTAEDKNVYLLNDLTAVQLRSGATVKVGDVSLNLDPSVTNFGLEEWQTSGVDITVKITDAEGREITDLIDLQADTTYNVAVSVSPKEAAKAESSGTSATVKSGDDFAAINVFKPELTYKDGEVYYGDTVPDTFTENLAGTKWKHNNAEADTTTMGSAPKLALDYTPDADKIKDNKIDTKQDIDVNVAVKIGAVDVTADTTFIHKDCTDEGCEWTVPAVGGNPAFLLHVKTCQLTIEKTGGASDEPYVFTIKKGGAKYSEVTIVGNGSETIYELPVGTYTIEEDEGWSWRYTANDDSSAVLTSQNPEGTISCANSKAKDYWLNGFSSVWENRKGVPKGKKK